MAKPIHHFYNQPLTHRFGQALRESLAEPDWQTFEAAVAWVRQLGTKHIETAMKAFLDRGGSSSFSVGLDSGNTSKEGLESLLKFEHHGYSHVYVYHNEANVLYHPKVYLLSNTKKARLIVGSNNLTQAGLFRNTEAGLQLEGAKDDPAIIQAMQALMAWRDTTSPFVRLLGETLLNDLVAKDYVLPEKALRQKQGAGRKKRSEKERLFGLQDISVPPIPSDGDIVLSHGAVGAVLLMRVRRASETERRTQVQIPIRVVRTGFFGKDASVTSAHDGRVHTLRRAAARGATNTIKLELPEIDPMVDPVVRFERKKAVIEYQVYDCGSTLGTPIMEALKRGLSMAPPATQLSLPSRPHNATWWRFV
ncbi:MAG: hypothetical protein ACYTFQ_19985 [Planctomycetota bacterium]|jgi:hypothetical protein